MNRDDDLYWIMDELSDEDWDFYKREYLGMTDDCPTLDDLHAYFKKTCDPELAERIAKHLEQGCRHCEPCLRGYESGAAAAKAGPLGRKPPPGSMLERIHRECKPGNRPRPLEALAKAKLAEAAEAARHATTNGEVEATNGQTQDAPAAHPVSEASRE